jgi:hypothetical protein
MDDPDSENLISLLNHINAIGQNYILVAFKMVYKLLKVATGDFHSNFVPKRVRKSVGLRNYKSLWPLYHASDFEALYGRLRPPQPSVAKIPFFGKTRMVL